MEFLAELLAIGIAGMAVAAFRYREAWTRIGHIIPAVSLFGLVASVSFGIGIAYALENHRAAYGLLWGVVRIAAGCAVVFWAYVMLGYFAGKEPK